MNPLELINVIEECATITIQIKENLSYSPSLRIQNRKFYYDLYELKEKFGGFINEYGTLVTWVWNIEMIKKYLPLIIPHLEGKTKEKAEIVLKASNCCHGRGKSQDKGKLKELYTQIKKLQAPRIRTKNDYPF